MARASDVDPDEVVGYKALIRDPFTGIEFWIFLTPAEYQTALRYLIDYEAGRIGTRRRWEEFARRVYDAYVPPDVRRYIPIGYFTYYLFYNVVKFERFEAIVEKKTRRYQVVLTYYIPETSAKKSLSSYAGTEDLEELEHIVSKTQLIPIAEFRTWTTVERELTPSEERTVIDYLKDEVAFMFSLFSSLAVSIFKVGGRIRYGVERGVLSERGAMITTRTLRDFVRGKRYLLPSLRGARVKRKYYTESDFITADERIMSARRWGRITNTHPLRFMRLVKREIRRAVERAMKSLEEGDMLRASEIMYHIMRNNYDAGVCISALDWYGYFVAMLEELMK